MDEIVCEKCKARLAVFEEDQLKCTCGAVYNIDRSNPSIPVAHLVSKLRTNAEQEQAPTSKQEPKLRSLYAPDWEELPTDLVFDEISLRRARVPGGWLVYGVEKQEGSIRKRRIPIGLTFVPDPTHAWDGGSPW